MEKKRFDVEGMTCSACSAAVERAVAGVDGVKKVNVNLLSNTMDVEYDQEITGSDNIVKSVQDAGYNASLQGGDTLQDGEVKGKKELNGGEYSGNIKRLIASIVFTVILMYFSMGHMLKFPMPQIFHDNALILALTQFLLTLPVIAVNYKYYVRGFKALIKRHPNMDTLIAIGSAASVIYGIIALYMIGYGMGISDNEIVDRYAMDLYFESAAMILTLITLGKTLESKAKKKTGAAIEKLIGLRPDTATVIRNGQEMTVKYKDIVLGDIITVKAGETIAVDGEIIEGEASVNEANITGESIPREKNVGDSVIGACMVTSGYLKIKATRVGEDTTLATIIKLVEEASSTKAPIARIADKISGVFVPVVLVLSAISFIVWLATGKGFEFALSIAISVLVISCPCALGLATPTAIMVATGKGAERGILFRNAEALEVIGKAKVIVMDKTGTITKGSPEVKEIKAFGVSEGELISIAYSLEDKSEHPLAGAICDYARNNNYIKYDVKDYKALSGMGISANVDNNAYLIGNKRLMEDNNIEYPAIDEWVNKGRTIIYVAKNNNIIGMIAISDTVRETSKAAIEILKKHGIRVIMLTGDNKASAKAVNSEVHADEVIAEVLPQGKADVIKRLKDEGNIVAMVGDGINDAPALAIADVGIAIGAGQDIALESGDVVLVRNDLNDVVSMFELSKRTIVNIKENLFWALIYNSICIPIAMGVLYPLTHIRLSPMLGALAMSLSSVCVVLNALRLKLFRPSFEKGKNKNVTDILDKGDNDSCACNGEQRDDIIDKTECNNKENAYMNKRLTIDGMMCMHCVARVEKTLLGVEGVKSVKVSLDDKSADVVLESNIDNDILIKAIEDAGYEVTDIR